MVGGAIAHRLFGIQGSAHLCEVCVVVDGFRTVDHQDERRQRRDQLERVLSTQVSSMSDVQPSYVTEQLITYSNAEDASSKKTHN